MFRSFSALSLTLVLFALMSAPAVAAPGFSLSSPQIAPGGTIARDFAYTQCSGGNMSPRLEWRDPPASVRSYAVTMFDPDAGGGFWHWIAFNIGVGAYGLNPGAGTPHSGDAPGDTVQWTNGFGERGYSGPCPPPGNPHHYVFTVYALDMPVLPVSAAASTDAVIATIRKHAIATATLTARYQQ